MKNIVISALLVVFMIGCGGNNPKKPSVKVNPKTAIKVQTIIPFAKSAKVASNIKNECKLQNGLSKSITDYSLGEGVAVIRKKKVSKRSKGKALVVSITNAVSTRVGLAHSKFLSKARFITTAKSNLALQQCVFQVAVRLVYIKDLVRY